MSYLADVVENDDGAPFDLKAIGMQYYKMIKIFDVTLDKDSMKKYTDALRNTIAQIKIDIAGDTDDPPVEALRSDLECTILIYDETSELGDGANKQIVLMYDFRHPMLKVFYLDALKTMKAYYTFRLKHMKRHVCNSS
jgi:hypothetical protein